jgi:DNA-binding CsgD family transcriptional regulator
LYRCPCRGEADRPFGWPTPLEVSHVATGADDSGGAAQSESALGSGLTPRERDVVTAVMNGCSNQESAERCSLSEATVKHHLTKSSASRAGLSFLSTRRRARPPTGKAGPSPPERGRLPGRPEGRGRASCRCGGHPRLQRRLGNTPGPRGPPTLPSTPRRHVTRRCKAGRSRMGRFGAPHLPGIVRVAKAH